MKKIIVIDHPLCNLQGHHYECSISVAEAALRAGYQPIILANRAFSRSLLSRNYYRSSRIIFNLVDSIFCWLISKDFVKHHS